MILFCECQGLIQINCVLICYYCLGYLIFLYNNACNSLMIIREKNG